MSSATSAALTKAGIPEVEVRDALGVQVLPDILTDSAGFQPDSQPFDL